MRTRTSNYVVQIYSIVLSLAKSQLSSLLIARCTMPKTNRLILSYNLTCINLVGSKTISNGRTYLLRLQSFVGQTNNLFSLEVIETYSTEKTRGFFASVCTILGACAARKIVVRSWALYRRAASCRCPEATSHAYFERCGQRALRAQWRLRHLAYLRLQRSSK